MKRLILLGLGLTILGLSVGCLYPERESRRGRGPEERRDRPHDERRDKDRDDRRGHSS